MDIDQEDYVCGPFIDLRKASDTVDHKILIKKLNYYGIGSISNKSFQSYLVKRQQLVLIYINDLHKAFINLNITHFANDTNLCFHAKNWYNRIRCQR